MTKRKTAIVILAAGKGTRMKSALPKVLHPLAGRPMINHVVAGAQTLSPDTIAVVLGPDMDDVAAAVSPDALSVAVVVQKEALGTGHAVLCAKEALSGFDADGHVLVLFGDTPLLTTQTMEGILSLLDDTTPLAVLAMRVGRDNRYGRLVVDDDGNLARIVEYADASPEERLIDLCNSGLLAGRAGVLFSLLDGLSSDNAKGEYYLTDIVSLAAGQGLKCAFEVADEAELLGVNDRSDLARAEAVVQGRLREAAMEGGVTMIDPFTVWLSFDTKLGADVTLGPNVFFGPGVTVGDGVEIRAFSHIEGAQIAAGAQIGPYARLRPGAKIGQRAKVGNFVEIKKSDIGEGAKVSHLTYLGDATVGAQANIGAGTITCNYDGFDKFETRIGANAFIGSNTALVAPVTVGEGAIVGAGSVITKDVDAEALALTRSEQKATSGWAAKFRDSKKKAR